MIVGGVPGEQTTYTEVVVNEEPTLAMRLAAAAAASTTGGAPRKQQRTRPVTQNLAKPTPPATATNGTDVDPTKIAADVTSATRRESSQVWYTN